MPAIVPIEDLKAAQEEGLSIYALFHALCSLRYAFGGDGAALVEKISASCGLRRAPRKIERRGAKLNN